MKMTMTLSWMIATTWVLAGAASVDPLETPPPDVCIDAGSPIEDSVNAAIPSDPGQCRLTDGWLPGDGDSPTVSCDLPCAPIETEIDEFAATLDFVACDAAASIVNAPVCSDRSGR